MSESFTYFSNQATDRYFVCGCAGYLWRVKLYTLALFISRCAPLVTVRCGKSI